MEELLAEQKAQLLVRIASQFSSDVILQKQNLMEYAEAVFEAVNTCLEPRTQYSTPIKAPPLLTPAKICDIFRLLIQQLNTLIILHDFTNSS